MTARRLRALAMGLVLVAPVLAPAFAGAGGSAACAAGRPHAALVVDTGSRTTTYCVALPATTVTGLRLIQLAAAQYGLEYRFGFGGQAVCELRGVGATGGDCFGDYPDYWGYWHGNGSGGWMWAGSGAGSSSIGDGEIDGWSWGSGDSGSTHPQPPRVRFSDVCTVVSPSPSPTAEPTKQPSSSPSAEPTVAAQEPSPAASRSATPKPSNHLHPPSQAPPTSPASPVIVRAVAASGTTPSSGGPPVGALAAAGAVLILGVAGWVRLRRNEGRSP